jgi:cytochrome P450
MPAATLPSIDEIPIYSEGDSEAESMRRAEADPVGFHRRAFRAKGPVYRTLRGGQMVVMFAGLESNEFIWKNTTLWSYYNTMAGFREGISDDHVTALDDPHHRHKRTMLKPAFDQMSAMRYLPAYNTVFHDRLKEASTEPKIELVHWWVSTLARAQARTVARVGMSDEELDKVSDLERTALAGVGLGEQRAAYFGAEHYRRLKAEGMALLGREIDARLADPQKYDDNFTQVLQARLKAEGENVSRDVLIDDLYLVLVAGLENTAKLIGSTLGALLRDPAWLAEIRAELEPWDGRDVMALTQMPRLKATIMEMQRLFPPAMFMPREAVKDFEFGGYFIPAGTVLLHMQTLCQYLEEFYEEPLRFKPQRFVDKGQFVAKTLGFFGGGTHICVGRNHTLVQTPIALAQMLKYYDFEVVEEKTSLGAGPLAAGHALKEFWVRLVARE